MPRKPSLSLRGRIVIAFGILGFLLSILFALGAHLSYEMIEHELLVDMLERELAATGENAHLRTDGGAIRVDHYVSGSPSWPSMPGRYRSLPPGFHEVGINNQERHVLVKDVNGLRNVLVFRDENVERREETLLSMLAVGVLLAAYAAIWMGFVTSRRVISPVGRLAREVRDLREHGEEKEPFLEYADDEVGELANAFQAYRNQLHDLVTREKLFTGTVSHELRTPLTVIGNNVDVLLADETRSPDERDRLLKIRRAVSEAADLVSTFLFMARSEEKPAGECDPRIAIEDVVHSASGRLGVKAEVRIAADAPTLLLVPEAVLATVVRNLVHNAIEHGQGPVVVRLERDRLEVEDAGGAPLWQRSGRLGLDIVQRICKRENWDLEIDSTPPGTRIHVNFSGD